MTHLVVKQTNKQINVFIKVNYKQFNAHILYSAFYLFYIEFLPFQHSSNLPLPLLQQQIFIVIETTKWPPCPVLRATITTTSPIQIIYMSQTIPVTVVLRPPVRPQAQVQSYIFI